MKTLMMASAVITLCLVADPARGIETIKLDPEGAPHSLAWCQEQTRDLAASAPADTMAVCQGHDAPDGTKTTFLCPVSDPPECQKVTYRIVDPAVRIAALRDAPRMVVDGERFMNFSVGACETFGTVVTARSDEGRMRFDCRYDGKLVAVFYCQATVRLVRDDGEIVRNPGTCYRDKTV